MVSEDTEQWVGVPHSEWRYPMVSNEHKWPIASDASLWWVRLHLCWMKVLEGCTTVSDIILWWERVIFGKCQHPVVNENTLWWVRVFPVRVSPSWVRELCGEWKCSMVSGNAPWWVKVFRGQWKWLVVGESTVSSLLWVWPMLYQWQAKHQVSTCVRGGPVYFSFWLLNLYHPHDNNVSRLTHWSWREKKNTWDISIQPRSDTFMGSLKSSQNSSCFLWMSIERVREIAIASGKGVVSPWQPLQRLKNTLYGGCFPPRGIGMVCFIATGKW